MGKVFNKRLKKESDKKERFLKRLKNIEDYGKIQLDKDSKSIKPISYFSQLSTKAKELYEKFKKKGY